MSRSRGNANVSPRTFRWSDRGPLLVKRGEIVVDEKWYGFESIIGQKGKCLGPAGIPRSHVGTVISR
jgi:hypothetical protein